MAVPLHHTPNNSGLSVHGHLTLDTRQSLPARGMLGSLLRLCHPRCPDCGRRGMIWCYVVPESYNEPSPRYFECEHCAARYFRMVTGPWFPASGPEFARCYQTNLAKAA